MNIYITSDVQHSSIWLIQNTKVKLTLPMLQDYRFALVDRVHLVCLDLLHRKSGGAIIAYISDYSDINFMLTIFSSYIYIMLTHALVWIFD
jgi:hypothetical protein